VIHRVRWDFDDVADRPVVCHVTQAFYPPGYAFHLHDHDYAEFFLVEQGPGRNLWQNGRETELRTGDLGFVAPNQVHALAAGGQQALTFLNLVIPLSLYAELQSRYHEDWPWSDGLRLFHLPADEAERLRRGLRHLLEPAACCSRLAVESLVLQALTLARRLAQQAAWPAWLQRCLRYLDEPDGLKGGVSGLADLVGCSREHLARSIKKHLGISARDLVTERRLAAAANLLRSSSDDPADIAYRCGYSNTSNFYRLFRRQFDCTPRQYRLRHDSRFV